HMPVGAVPRRDAMAPPQLPRDVPVAQVVEPLQVLSRPALRPEADAAVEGRLLRGALEPIDRDEPLEPRDPRLDLRVAAVTVPDGVTVRTVLGDEETQVGQAGAHPSACLVPIEAAEI